MCRGQEFREYPEACLVAEGSFTLRPTRRGIPLSFDGTVLRLTFEAQMKENFDRFKFALYKEKEMPAFRKWITALAGLALLAGLARAQVTGNGSSPGAFTCATTNASVTPTLRAEGYTEAVGDIVLICAGGTLPA